MFISVFDILTQAVLDYFDCPPNPDPRRVKLFWRCMFLLFIASSAVAVVISRLTAGDTVRGGIVAFALLTASSALIAQQETAKAKETAHRWWMGETKWYALFLTW